jgi:hypothetical protein
MRSILAYMNSILKWIIHRYHFEGWLVVLVKITCFALTRNFLITSLHNKSFFKIFFSRESRESVVENYAKKNRSRFRQRFFWPAWFVVAKRLQICFFGLATESLRILGRVMYRWKDFEITFPTVYYTPIKILKLHLQNEHKNDVVVSQLHIMLVKRTATDFGCTFFGHGFLLVLAFSLKHIAALQNSFSKAITCSLGLQLTQVDR